MDVLKQKETFVSIDKFHRKAIKEFGFLVGLHTKLVHWQDLQDTVQRLVDDMSSRKIQVEVLRKSVWVDADDERIGAQIFTVCSTVRNMADAIATFNNLCNEQQKLGPQVKFVSLCNSDTNFQNELADIIRAQWRSDDEQSAIPIVDMAMTAVEYVVNYDGVKNTIRNIIVQRAGLLSLESTNSSPHSGRFLAIVPTKDLEEKWQAIDEALEYVYDKLIPMSGHLRHRGHPIAQRQGNTRARPPPIARCQPQMHPLGPKYSPYQEQPKYQHHRQYSGNVHDRSNSISTKGTYEESEASDAESYHDGVESTGNSAPLRNDAAFWQALHDLDSKHCGFYRQLENNLTDMRTVQEQWYSWGSQHIRHQEAVFALYQEKIETCVRNSLRPVLNKLGMLQNPSSDDVSTELSATEALTKSWSSMSPKAQEHFLYELECTVMRNNASVLDHHGRLEDLNSKLEGIYEGKGKAPVGEHAKTEDQSTVDAMTAELTCLRIRLEAEVARNDALKTRLQALEENQNITSRETNHHQSDSQSATDTVTRTAGHRIEAYHQLEGEQPTSAMLESMNIALTHLSKRVGTLEDLEDGPCLCPD